MNISAKTVRRTLAAFALLFCCAQLAKAQDPVKVDPEHYKVLKETAAVRVLEYKDVAPHTVPKHSHPHYFVYVFTDAKRIFSDCVHTAPVTTLTAGEVLEHGPVTHCEQTAGNPGDETHVLIFELKPQTAAAKPRSGRRR